MSKEEFLNLLDRKLQVINEKERRDIIDEYRTHIEMKMAEGKSEDEVIEDFGNVDELVDEILDAYKINTSRVNNNFDHKFNDFMDDMYNGFKRFIGSFTSLEVDDVVRLIFEIILILILLAVLHIPFYMVESLGSSLLRGVIGFGIGNVLAGVWKVVIELAYVVVFIVVIVNVVSKRVQRYRSPENFHDDSSVFEDFKSSFNFDGKRTTTTHTNKNYNSSYRSEGSKQDYYDDTQEHDFDENIHEDMSEDDSFNEEKREGYESYSERMRNKNPKTDRVNGTVAGVLRTLMRIFFVLLSLPFIFIIIGLCCLLGAMVVFSVQGFTLFGAYFLVIGGIMITSAFLSLLKTVLWGRG